MRHLVGLFSLNILRAEPETLEGKQVYYLSLREQTKERLKKLREEYNLGERDAKVFEFREENTGIPYIGISKDTYSMIFNKKTCSIEKAGILGSLIDSCELANVVIVVGFQVFYCRNFRETCVKPAMIPD